MYRRLRDAGYLDPSLDTTIFAIVLRMEAPIQGFSRYAIKEFDMDGVTIPADPRAIVFYGAANRDEREYPDPGRFDVRRCAAS